MEKTRSKTKVALYGTRPLAVLASGLAVMLMLMPSSYAGDLPHSALHFGVRCQADFQENWDPVWDNYGMCTNFINTIKRTDWVDFYFNLHGAQVAFVDGNAAETCSRCGGADSVDFFLIATHGGIDERQSRYAMWDFQARAWSGSMRFGDTGQQLKVFATYTCDTLNSSDGHLWDRMGRAFRGGVKLIVGAHGSVYNGAPQKGADFASRMQHGEAISTSWLEAVWYSNNNNRPAASATGVNANDCRARLDMNLESVRTSTPLRDGQIGHVCWREWSN